MAAPTPLQDPTLLKWGSLAFLVVWSVAFSVCFRYARLQPGPMFSNLSAVVVSECVKATASAYFIVTDHGVGGLGDSLKSMLWTDCKATLTMGIPGCLYSAQNYLFFVGITNLSVCLFQVSKQLAILTTAIVWVIAKRQLLGAEKWFSLVALVAGVALITADGDIGAKGDLVVGLLTVLGACLLSSVASVFMEAALQTSSHSLWERNVQLAIFGVLFGVAAIYVKDPDLLTEGTFFEGYTPAAWGTVLLHSIGGLATAAALKYSDSVMKCVVKSVAVIVGAVVSRVGFAEGPELTSLKVIAGIVLTLLGSTVYSLGGEKLRELCGQEKREEEKPSQRAVAYVGEEVSKPLKEVSPSASTQASLEAGNAEAEAGEEPPQDSRDVRAGGWCQVSACAV